MLVLSRKVGEEILLPELGITIRLLKQKGKAATIGVEAPAEYRVLRGELTQFEPPQGVCRPKLAASA